MYCPICQNESKHLFNTKYVQVRQCLNASCQHKFHGKSLPAGGVMDYSTSDSDNFLIYQNRNFQMIDYLLNQGYVEPGSKVLDFGCGEGNIAQAFSDRDFDVTGVELSESGRKILDKRGLVNYPEMREIPPERRFDLILMIEVIEHLELPLSLLEEAKNRLTEQGIIFVTTPCANSLKTRVVREKGEPYREPTHIQFFSSQSLELCFQKAGFSKFKRFYLPWMIPNRSPLMKMFDRLLYGIDLNSHLTYFLFKE